MRYRKEIDGLRAVAVVSVILFHAGFDFAKGGFVGVDIFFVISGYLIGSIILKEKQQGTFSLLHFYERRARRILPALFFVMFCSLIVAWQWMLPVDLKDFGQSFIATALFSSNILFWHESGYFSGLSELKPLLHTWSLAVEEQYYVIFPIFILLCWRLGLKWIMSLLLLIAIVSLLLAHWSSQNYPDASFYLLHTRIWELLLGVFGAYYFICRDKQNPHKSRYDEFFSLIGFVLIVFSITVFDRNTLFPSFWALVPTVGTLLIIVYAQQNTWINRLLSFRPVVVIGLVSYSFYLWHQPLFAFARIRSLKEVTPSLSIALIFVSLLLAVFSWKFVEQPFRSRTGKITRKHIFGLSLFAIILSSSIGAVIHSKDGFLDYFIQKNNVGEWQKASLVLKYWRDRNPIEMKKDGACKFSEAVLWGYFPAWFDKCKTQGEKITLVIGDSHSMNMYNILYDIHHNDYLIGVNQDSCRIHDENKCHYEKLFNIIVENKHYIEKVIYHQSGAYFLNDEEGEAGSHRVFSKDSSYSINEANIVDVIDYLNELSEFVSVAWVGPFAELRVNGQQFLSPNVEPEINSVSMSRFAELEKKLTELTSNTTQFKYVSFNDLFDVHKDFVFVGNCFTYKDEDHFSKCGEEIISKSIPKDIL